jgi:hypothetical protein
MKAQTAYQKRVIDNIQEAIAQFQNPKDLRSKIKRMTDGFQTEMKDDPTVVVLADSRIMIPPEYIFGKNLGDVYVVQTVLENCGSQSITDSILHAISRYGCSILIIALTSTAYEDNIMSQRAALVIQNQLSKTCQVIGNLIKDGALEVYTYSINSINRSVTPIE